MPARRPKLRKIFGRDAWKDADFYGPYTDLTNSILYQDIYSVQSKTERTNRATLFIYPRDLEIMFGLSRQEAKDMIRYIRYFFKRDETIPVSCNFLQLFTGIDKEVIDLFVEES